MSFFPTRDREELIVIELDNEDPSKHIAGLLENAETKIQFSTALSDFYKSEEIQNSFVDIANRGISVDLLLDAGIDWEAKKKELATIFNAFTASNKLKVKQSKDKIPHWLIIDNGKHIRVEQEHKNDKNVIKTSNAILYFTTSETDEAVTFLITSIRDSFKEWWQESEEKPISVEGQ